MKALLLGCIAASDSPVANSTPNQEFLEHVGRIAGRLSDSEATLTTLPVKLIVCRGACREFSDYCLEGFGRAS